VIPAQRHTGLDVSLLGARKGVYEAAKLRRPERWSGQTRSWEPVLVVHLNPDKGGLENANKPEEKTALRKAA
jgi:putative transposase